VSRINPLYISLFLILLFFISIFKLDSAKTELIETEKSYNKSKKLAVELNSLKSSYTKRIVFPSSIKGLITQRKTKDTLVVNSKELDIKSLNLLMGRVINGAYNITKLNITRLDNTKVSLYMEIKW